MGADQYVSVDKRPVNVGRGTIKELLALYKEYLRNACQRNDGKNCPSKPFLYVQITCPVDSYDVNVEPAKDELLFYEAFKLKDLFEELLIGVYGKFESNSDASYSVRKQNPGRTGSTSFDLLMARKPALEPLTPRNNDWIEETLVGPTLEASSNTPERARMSFNMYVGNDEAMQLAPNNLSIVEGEPSNHRDVSANNLWAIAKMNVVLSPKRMSSSARQTVTSEEPVASTTVDRASSPDTSFNPPVNSHPTHLGQNDQLPSPVTSPRGPEAPYQNPGPPSQVMRRRGRRMEDSDDDSLTSSSTIAAAKGPSLLDTWVEQSHNASQRTLTQRQAEPGFTHPASQDSSVGQSPVRKGRISLPPKNTGRLRQPNIDQGQDRAAHPFKTPFRRGTHYQSSISGSEPGDEIIDNCGSPPSSAVRDRTTQRTLSPVKSSSISSNQRDLNAILEFERQKRIAVAQQRKQAAQRIPNRAVTLPSSNQSQVEPVQVAVQNNLPIAASTQDQEVQEAFNDRFEMGNLACTPISQPEPRSNNPHQNRYLAAIRHLERPQSLSKSASGDAAPVFLMAEESSLKIPDSNPRGYLIHHNRVRENKEQEDDGSVTKIGSKIKTKTTRLPLESIPAGENTCNLTTIIPAPDQKALATQTSQLVKIDEYLTMSEVTVAPWDPSEMTMASWEITLRNLIKRRLQQASTTTDESSEAREEPAFEMDLAETLKKHYYGIWKVRAW